MGSSSWRVAGALCAAGAGALLACGPSLMTPEERRLDAALDRAGQGAYPGGARLRKLVGRAEHGELEDGFIVMLGADTCYAVVGVGDARVRALEVLVTSPTGAWLAKTKEPRRDPSLRVCAKVSGPHRIGVKVSGRGDYVFGVFGDPPAEAAASASASVGPSPSAAASTSVAPLARACEAIAGASPFERRVEAEHRACAADADCITLKADCGGLRCAGVNRAHRSAYGQPLDCRGYTGEVAARDCDPQLGLEAPRCEAGCCVSAPVAKP